MHRKDLFTWVYLPWIILLGNFIINLAVTAIISSGEVNMSTGGMFSIYIYFLITGMLTLYQTFPFALGLNIRRKDYFWGTAATIGIISIATSVCFVLLSAIEEATNRWGNLIAFFHVPYIIDNGMIGELWFYAALLAHLYYAGFVISCIHRRFGALNLTIVLAVLFLAATVFSVLASYYGWWGDILELIQGRSAVEIISWCSLLTLVYMGISYQLLRRATA
jgi:hypothetical protein